MFYAATQLMHILYQLFTLFMAIRSITTSIQTTHGGGNALTPIAIEVEPKSGPKTHNSTKRRTKRNDQSFLTRLHCRHAVFRNSRLGLLLLRDRVCRARQIRTRDDVFNVLTRSTN